MLTRVIVAFVIGMVVGALLTYIIPKIIQSRESSRKQANRDNSLAALQECRDGIQEEPLVRLQLSTIVLEAQNQIPRISIETKYGTNIDIVYNAVSQKFEMGERNGMDVFRVGSASRVFTAINSLKHWVTEPPVLA